MSMVEKLANLVLSVLPEEPRESFHGPAQALAAYLVSHGVTIREETGMLRCDPKAWARCPERGLCADCREEACFTEGSDCHRYNMEVVAQPMTNADHIRGMTDEELLDLMRLIALESGCPPGNGETTCKYDRCVDCWGAWLRQPAGDGCP